MKKLFGTRADAQQAYLYTITGGGLTAEISDHGATIVKLLVPDAAGNVADVVLGFDTPEEYSASTTYFGTVVGRNANRIGGASFPKNGKTYQLPINDNGKNSLHSGPNCYKDRLWQVVSHTESSIQLRLDSPDGDQGYPGNAVIHVTYTLEAPGTLKIVYDGICDQDTVFNMTNHSYFNLAGHDKPERSLDQLLCMPARLFTAADAGSIPTGQLPQVEGTPMDFRTPKAIGRDIEEDYFALKLQNGYDHNFEVYTNPCAVLTDPVSGRTMSVETDCCGVQFYCGNFLAGDKGKDGVCYCFRGGVCLETQFYPDAVNHPEWKQPFVKADTPYHSETKYIFG